MLEVVAEQTGYPTDLLDMELDLEADLGIDTVKQAEVFASIRETYGIERDDALKLRDYPTLNHVVGFVRDRLPKAEEAAAAPATIEAPDAPVAEAPSAPAPAPAGGTGTRTAPSRPRSARPRPRATRAGSPSPCPGRRSTCASRPASPSAPAAGSP